MITDLISQVEERLLIYSADPSVYAEPGTRYKLYFQSRQAS
jgi:hypothetical protein